MTTNLLTVVDETTAGETLGEVKIAFETERVTVKDIIASRVEMEVRNYNEKLTEHFQGLVRPSEAEETLNGYRMKNRAAVDAEKQVYIALAAFQSNGYFVFVDSRQAGSLDDEVTVTPGTKVSFGKLTPIVGG